MRPLLVLLLLIAPGRAMACSVALVLAMDVSGSVNTDEYELQMGGLADALGDPLVSEALVMARATVTLVQWSGRSRQRISIPWRTVDSHADVTALRAEVLKTPRAYRNYATAIGEVLTRAADLFADAPRPCDRRVIDVSGDGRSNEGLRPRSVHPRLAREGITVNGLAIRGTEDGIVGYYRERVMFGPGAFVEIADGYADYPRAIRRKLVTELVQNLSEEHIAPAPVLRADINEGDEPWRSASATRSNGPGGTAPGRAP